MSSINFLEGTTTSSPVPEPSTWAMMLLGFAGLACLLGSAARKDECLNRVSFQNRLQKGRLWAAFFFCFASTHLDNEHSPAARLPHFR